MSFVVAFIHLAARLLTLLVIINAFLSYFLTPYHPVRQIFARIIEPLMAPIRRVVPPVGMIDFSPVVLIILIQIFEYVVTSVLGSIR
ncbi:MAG TPA: YggT family protein [Anaerolineaceae bacterium]